MHSRVNRPPRRAPFVQRGFVNPPTDRLARRIRHDFPDSANEVITRLTDLPDTSQASERIQAAIVLKARGDFQRFLYEAAGVSIAWRDALMGSGLEHGDHEAQLDRILGSL